jgi:hypothetical protein
MQPPKVYRYRNFSSLTVDSLCRDELFFSDPAVFNDPLDCQPSVEADSKPEELRTLLSELINRRIFSETISSLNKINVEEASAKKHATKLAIMTARDKLNSISYYSTDPEYDCSREEAERWLLTLETERELLKRYDKGVCCFSSVYDNPLLWSHYADQHRGMCIGYDLIRNPKPIFHKVIYGGNRIVKTSLIINAVINDDSEANKILDQNILLRKASPWSYEKEWRIIGQRGLHHSPLRLIEITFGLRCSEGVKHSIISALKNRERNINFYEIHEIRGSFKLKRREIDLGEIQEFYPKVACSGVEMFGTVDDS